MAKNRLLRIRAVLRLGPSELRSPYGFAPQSFLDPEKVQTTYQGDNDGPFDKIHPDAASEVFMW